MSKDTSTRTIHRSGVLVDPLPMVLRPAMPSRPKELRLSQGSCTLGSGSRCDLVIDDPTVSRLHAKLTLVPEGVLVQDQGSRNGTLYLGQRITTAVLAPGTRLSLGGATLMLDLDEEQLGASAAAAPRTTTFRGMSGTTAAMVRLFTTISRLDGSLVPVLVHGESGVGKELVARAIHEGSRVCAAPFVAINCGAVSRELIASTLFGHARGAFTGAVNVRKGAFAAADGGTLMLDEIGELPLDVQPALLRALETGETVPVGEDTPRRVSVRLLAVTHRDLPELVRQGKFREDLYFRLAVVVLEVPPLRERREDIASLARFFARQEGAPDLEDDVIEELAARPLPGNVRELRNAVLAYLALGSLGTAPQSLLPPASRSGPEPPVRFDASYLAQRDAMVDAFTRRYLAALLEHTRGNQSEAARIAGLDRTYLGRMLVKLGLLRAR
ncbi:MAG: Response regulator of zinc sigma-54-dependent two-component system [Labilithrix sp.]|nr:Response regulator of zinc sigma-54-dependent two-component system [Labilithrix sp.]